MLSGRWNGREVFREDQQLVDRGDSFALNVLTQCRKSPLSLHTVQAKVLSPSNSGHAASKESSQQQPSSPATNTYRTENDRFQSFLVKEPDPNFDHAKDMTKKMQDWDKKWKGLGDKNSP